MPFDYQSVVLPSLTKIDECIIHLLNQLFQGLLYIVSVFCDISSRYAWYRGVIEPNKHIDHLPFVGQLCALSQMLYQVIYLLW